MNLHGKRCSCPTKCAYGRQIAESRRTKWGVHISRALKCSVVRSRCDCWRVAQRIVCVLRKLGYVQGRPTKKDKSRGDKVRKRISLSSVASLLSCSVLREAACVRTCALLRRECQSCTSATGANAGLCRRSRDDFAVYLSRGVCRRKIATWLILPVVIRSSQRLSHACLSINLLL